jgi:hypothetical protein
MRLQVEAADEFVLVDARSLHGRCLSCDAKRWIAILHRIGGRGRDRGRAVPSKKGIMS